MVDDNPNIIKPVDGLQNIAHLAPVRRREQRNRRQEPNKENKQEAEQEPNQSVDKENAGKQGSENNNDNHTIDYCA
jgi:hypothetical protein